jgi:hypothetical protein
MAEWIYFIHAPRENFADTMTDEEEAVWSQHVPRVTPSRSHVTLASTAELAHLSY